MSRMLQGATLENHWECAPDILFTLSTNFLLYVALILIVYLVVKLYIENAPDNALFHDVYSSHYQGPLARHAVDTSSDSLPYDSSMYVPIPSSKTMVDFDVGSSEQPQSEYYSKIILLGLGLNITFVICSIIQERILKMEYGPGEFFTYTYGLVFFNRFVGLLISSLLMYYARLKWSKAIVHEYAFVSLTNILSSWCQYESLKFVTMPTQMLSKALKLAPIMIMGKILGNKSYPLYEYAVAGMIGLGEMVFISSSEGFQLGQDSFGREGRLGCGILLLSLALMFDSFTAQWQSRMFAKYRDLSPIQMMFVMNAFSTVFSMITLVHASELNNFVAFVYNHPEIRFHFFAFSLCSTVGQLLIFHTIGYFGALHFTIIMNVRIALSILASCIIYHHPLKELGVLGLFVVFGAIGYHIVRRLEGKKLLSFASAKANTSRRLLFHGWHQHVDF